MGSGPSSITERLGAFAIRRKFSVLAATALLVACAIAIIVHGGKLTTGDIDGLEAGVAARAAAGITGATEDATLVCVLSSKAVDPRPDAFEIARDRALAPVRESPRVLYVMTKEEAPPPLRSAMQKGTEKRETVFIALRGDFKTAAASYPEVRRALASGVAGGPLDARCTGRTAYMHDLDETLSQDLLFAEAVSLPIALAVLLWVFRTAVLALVPVVCGAAAVLVAIATVTALSFVTDVAAYTINVMSLIGLGVAIDYSLFIVSRYREELASAPDVTREIALVRAADAAGRAVAFSGLAVCAGLSGLAFFRGSYLSAMGAGGAIVVAFAVLAALVFVPALLAALGPHAFRLRLRKAAPELGVARWHRLVGFVMKHPWLVLLPTTAALLLAARPFSRLEMSAADVRVLDDRSEARRTYDVLRRDFPEQAAPRATVVVRFPSAPALTSDRIRALYTFSREAAKIPGVVKIESIVNGASPDPEEDYGVDTYEENLLHPSELVAPLVEAGKKLTVGERDVVLYVVLRSAPDSEEARAVVRSLRAHRTIADGALVVGGATANDLDTTAYMIERAPRAIAFVVIVTLVVLFWQLRSVLLPLKAIVMNALSIGASFGALVWVFQDGRLFVKEGHPLEPTLPVLLFAVIFGLSMDYEVLILGRVREEWRRTRDMDEAVATGVSKTAGLVTSAAAIMVAVFSAFVLARVVLVQATGFGMALAVLVDATLVRVLLVPATMKLLGKWNFWPGD